ncbi:hypothetical protein QZH41_019653, partial [Actinostola sp. cb2023]
AEASVITTLRMSNSTASKLSCSQFGCYSPQLVLHGNGNSCCESTHQIQEGLPGHSVCPCQLDRVLQHRVASMPVNVLPRPPFGDTAYTIGSGSGLSAFYSPLARACEIKDVPQPWRDSWYLSHATRGPFELHSFDPHTHTACSRFAERFSPIDLAAAGARRKNATRETTSTLKAWLYEHRKNPYPTKGEKIMLAILTKMTLTQVSTWFANARRRLKKENKMTWSPRNRCGERKDGGDASDVEDVDLDLHSDDEQLASESQQEFTKGNHNRDNVEDDIKEVKKEIIDFRDKIVEHKASRDSPDGCSERNENVSRGVVPTTVAPSPAITTSPPNLSRKDHHISSNSVEDSPVKSLRKWVDGCFHNSVVTSCPTSVQSLSPEHYQTPPSTPPQRTSTETPVISSGRVF